MWLRLTGLQCHPSLTKPPCGFASVCRTNEEKGSRAKTVWQTSAIPSPFPLSLSIALSL